MWAIGVLTGLCLRFINTTPRLRWAKINETINSSSMLGKVWGVEEILSAFFLQDATALGGEGKGVL